MAYISERGDYYRLEIRRRGFKPTYRTFDTKKQVEQFARQIESEIDACSFIDQSEAKRTALSETLDRYKIEIASAKSHPAQENYRIERWKKTNLSHRTLASLRGVDFAAYRDQRRSEGLADNTVRLELQIISHLFEIARKEWGMEGLQNPLKNIRKPSGATRRDRRLRAGEYDSLKAELGQHGNPAGSFSCPWSVSVAAIAKRHRHQMQAPSEPRPCSRHQCSGGH